MSSDRVFIGKTTSNRRTWTGVKRATSEDVFGARFRYHRLSLVVSKMIAVTCPQSQKRTSSEYAVCSQFFLEFLRRLRTRHKNSSVHIIKTMVQSQASVDVPPNVHEDRRLENYGCQSEITIRCGTSHLSSGLGLRQSSVVD